MSGSKRGFALGFVISFAVVAAAVWAAGKFLSEDGTAPLTRDILEQNERLWTSKGPKDYDLTLLKSVDKIGDERYQVSIRGDQIEMTLNGRQVKRPTDAYTILGLFDMMRRELELAGTADAPSGTRRRTLLFASFVPTNGLPRRVKALAGQGSSFVMEVERVVNTDGSVVYPKPSS